MHFTGGWLQPTGYNPILNCNQFEKNYPGLPFAYGIYVDSLAGMEFIGGVQLGQTPAGNGWVGLSPANSGYAVWNHPNNVQLTYFRYVNEQVNNGIVFNTNAPQAGGFAVPYLDPITNNINPNATCIENPLVFFPRSSGNTVKSNETLAINSDDVESKPFVYPNPASTQIMIEMPDQSGPSIAYSIFDLTGKSLISGKLQAQKSNRMELNISELTPGVYFLELVSEGRTDRIRLIKQ